VPAVARGGPSLEPPTPRLVCRGLSDAPPQRSTAWTNTITSCGAWPISGSAPKTSAPIFRRVSLAAELKGCIERSDRAIVPGLAKILLVRWMVSQLYPPTVISWLTESCCRGTGHAPGGHCTARATWIPTRGCATDT